MLNNQENKLCPNCDKAPGTGKYCQECSQKNTPLKLNLLTIFGDFFAIVFNLDNKFFRTLRAAFVPGKLAKSFIQGKRKLYLNPFRFFFYSWVLLALVINTDFGNKNSFQDGISDGWDSYSTRDSAKVIVANNDDFHIQFMNKRYHFTSDTAKYNASQKDTTIILYQDLESLEEKELFNKYNINTWFEKLFIKRVKKFKSGSFGSLITFLQKNLIWLFFFVIPFSAISLSILFRRSKKYYSEHILYLMYLFSVLFIVMSIFIFLGQIALYTNPIIAFLLIVLVLFYISYSFRSMKAFYQRSTKMTVWKWFIYLFGNYIIFGMGSLIYLVMSLLLS